MAGQERNGEQGPATLLSNQTKRYIAGGHHLDAQASPTFLLNQPGKESPVSLTLPLAPILMPTAPGFPPRATGHKQEALPARNDQTASPVTHLPGERLWEDDKATALLTGCFQSQTQQTVLSLRNRSKRAVGGGRFKPHLSG